MLLKSDYSILNVGILKKLSKKVKLTINLTKINLFENFNKYLATKVIQKYYRRHFYKNAVAILDSVVNYMIEEDLSHHLGSFVKNTKKLDEIRNQSILEIVPQYAELFNE